jgi:dipeptidase E
MPGTPFFTWPKPWVKEFLGSDVKELVFIPFAAVTFSMDEYEDKVRGVFNEMGYSITSLHRHDNKKQVIERTQGIVVGGGNTFALLSRMYEFNLLDLVRNRVQNGIPYIGWSAGANLASPTIMTTNDMPIIQPPSFRALDLIPCQINPHYHELKFENQGGETRRDRLEEFLVLNPSRKVIGLPEGMLVQGKGNHFRLQGNGIAKLYESGKPVQELKADQEISVFISD